MWIVKNMLKGTLLLQDLNLKIAAGDYFDLDAIGRDQVEGSLSLRTAFEEGYLQNIEKEGHKEGEQIVPGYGQLALQQQTAARMNNAELASQLSELRELLAAQKQQQPVMAASGDGVRFNPDDMKEALAAMAREVSGTIKDEMERLASQQRLISAEKQEVLSARNMSEAEIKARLALLDNKEQELKSNFAELGKSLGHQAAGDGAAADLADLLDGL